MDPPAYTATVPAPPTKLQRTLEDTRNLILANANIVRPSLKTEGPIELILGKTTPQRAPMSLPLDMRSFPTTRHTNGTSRAYDHTSSSSSSSSPGWTTDAAPWRERSVRQAGRHYAALVTRNIGAGSINMVVLGEPQESVEEALEWMLDRTQIIVTDMLATHGRQANASCYCNRCNALLSGERPSVSVLMEHRHDM